MVTVAICKPTKNNRIFKSHYEAARNKLKPFLNNVNAFLLLKIIIIPKINTRLKIGKTDIKLLQLHREEHKNEY